jgi:hypothetical protein
VWIVFRQLAKARTDRVVVDVVAMGEEVVAVADAVVGEASLPDWKLGAEAVGEAALDEHDRSLEGNDLWGEE